MEAGPRTDYYAVLEVARSSSPEEIKKAFFRLAKKYHPDVNPDDPTTAEAAFKRVNEAYAVLSDPTERKTYDMTHAYAGRMYTGPLDESADEGGAASFARAASRDFGRSPRSAYVRRDGADDAEMNASMRAAYEQWRADPMDFDVWNRMQFGPTQKEREWASSERVKEARATGFASFRNTNFDKAPGGGGSAEQRRGLDWEARRNARRAADAWEKAREAAGAERSHAATPGAAETGAYRAYARHYREAALRARAGRARIVTFLSAAAVLGAMSYAAYKIAHAS